MKTKFIKSGESYDGSQLVSLRNYLKHGLLGDSIVAWIGPCEVSPEHMVDGEDLVQGAKIAGAKMLHFIIEKFDISLFSAVALQRLLSSIVRDQIMQVATKKALAASLTRVGDDIYAGDRKLSISIATQSPVNSLIHFAVNLTNEGTPVKTLALSDLGVDARDLAGEVMSRFSAEVEDIAIATRKVRWVR